MVTVMNYIHDILYKLEGKLEAGLYNAVVEISSGENIKYEIDSSGRYLTADRALSPIFTYPFNYGYIPQTLAADGRGLDVVIVSPVPLAHLSVIKVKVLGYVPVSDGNTIDNKFIAIPAYSSLKKVSLEKIIAFFSNYKYPNNAGTSVGNFVSSPAEAAFLIETAHEKYLDSIEEVVEGIPEDEFQDQEAGVENSSEEPALGVAEPEPEKPVEKSPTISFIDDMLHKVRSVAPVTHLEESQRPVLQTEEDAAVDIDKPAVAQINEETAAEIQQNSEEPAQVAQEVKETDLEIPTTEDSEWLT